MEANNSYCGVGIAYNARVGGEYIERTSHTYTCAPCIHKHIHVRAHKQTHAHTHINKHIHI